LRRYAVARLIAAPRKIQAAGEKLKSIEEYAGLVNTRTSLYSVAIMNSPAGWSEPGQTPEFDEVSIVLSGVLHVQTKEGEFDVRAGQAVQVGKSEWVRYSTPREGAHYVAVCVPAFSPYTVHRDE
jgi:mannose-6-phosphate isomerase-like protein (cupin superfamily)